jgi:hypothetical protein
MLDYIAYLEAQRQVRELARSARPDAPIVPEPALGGSRPLRRGTAAALHRLAERLEPAPRASVGAR